ncbi:uncharacterized protein LOC114973474 [Acropora millepora]|uniref:uncharacterized protein LOC114973474 n=1 Tax=Acropora millepora TaxID=45264 RepID=UPI001CF5A4B6|nr:uncharacterized protein LOC114973474 [Acropora millepora]
MLNRNAVKYRKRKTSKLQVDVCISQFCQKIKEGPYYVCTVCNRMLYRKSVLLFNKDKYVNCKIENIFTEKLSFDNKEYICKTCHSKVIKGKVPCQAVYNDMFVEDIPTELSTLEKLEQILIAQRIVFQKIVVMPKGQQRKIKGAICNVPVECDKTCQTLPRAPESSGIILLKLKRKLQFRGHVYYQAVRPEIILNALNWLKANNELYKTITIDIERIDRNLTTLEVISIPECTTSINTDVEQPMNEQVISADENITEQISEQKNDKPVNETSKKLQQEEQEEEIDDPLNKHRAPTNETCIQAIIPDYPVTIDQQNVSTGQEIYSIAPGENKHPVSFMKDKNCEELAFPVLFPKGRFGYTTERKIHLTPTKYFNARLLHHSGRFANNPEYLFFAQFVIEQKKVSDSINIALKKVHGKPVTASHIRSSVQTLQNLICQDQAYLFLRQIPGTPPYWQRFMYEVVAMVKQLGIPTWFMTLSCADLRWPELFQIISRMQGKDITDEEVNGLSYDEKCKMLNLNPVIVAKHFQYRVEMFFTEVLLSKSQPIGKIVYYALRIEFQMRGSPHLHALIWTEDCPKLTSETKEAYIEFIDKHVQASLPNKDDNPELHDLVNFYQKHTHSKTCRKYKNIKCRFNFGQFFSNRTIIAEPLPDDLADELKQPILKEQKEILTSVKEKINTVLDPSKSEDYDPNLTETDIFNSLGITEEQYYKALSISPDSDYDLHLKRPLDSCFINNYFVAGIKGFAANVDLQPVFNHYKCITYVCSYFTKDETECSQAIMNAAKEAKANNLSVAEGLRKIGAAFLSTREVSSQECVYRCMPELWLRKIFPGTVFVSTDLPEKRIRVTKSKQQLDDLDDDSTDIFKSNIIERYSIRPDSNSVVDKLCLAEFAAYYYKDYKKESDETNDAQPNVLTDEVIHTQHSIVQNISLPPQITLMNTKEKMKCRKVKAVIRYHTPNKTKEPERYFHHLLMLYYPWRNESDLMATDQSYASKFNEPNVQEVVELNRSVFEPDADTVTEALENLRNNQGNIIHSYDPINDQENSDLQIETQNTFDTLPEESFNEQSSSDLGASSDFGQQAYQAISTYTQPTEISDDMLRNNIRSLNEKQRSAFNIALSWCRNTMKNLNCLKPEKLDPINLFVTGGAGAGKSHLIKAIYHTAVKTFRYGTINPEKPTVALMAPTGVAAININGTTIHTALSIPKESGDFAPKMSDQKRTQLRLTLSELKLIIVDEISMVANTTLLHIHQRLKEIFNTPNSELFASISFIAVGDLYQLPPIRRRAVFENFKNDTFNLCHPWNAFKMIELTEIMRQKDDKQFAELLNRIRTGTQTEADIQCIQSRSITHSASNYPHDALHIWAENKPVDEYNATRLNQIPAQQYTLTATDQYPQHVSKQDIDRVLAKSRSETGGLDYYILIKEGCRVMLTANIDIADRLINGQMGTVIKIALSEKTQKPNIVYIKFDDSEAGRKAITNHSNSFARHNNAVPIEQVLTKIKIRPGKPSSPEIQRTQFPLTLGYACTVHKVQGLTLKKVVVSFDLLKQRSFNYGQIYVALSRSTSLQGLHIFGNIEMNHVKANPKVHQEYERLREISQITNSLSSQIQSTVSNNDVTITLLNIRSLQKHSIDIKNDANIMNGDVIAFTETQLLPHNSDAQIRQNLHPFLLFRQDHNTDKYMSLAVCTKSHNPIAQHDYFPLINALKFELLNSRNGVKLSFLVIYRKQSKTIPDFITELEHILYNNDIDVVLGDFNINYMNSDDCNPLKSMMQSLSFKQVVKKPTYISSGTLLDHIYLKSSRFNVLENKVINVYYSDHDAIKISIQKI